MADHQHKAYFATDWKPGTPWEQFTVRHYFDPSVDLRRAFRMTRELATEMKKPLKLMQSVETVHEIQQVFPE